MESLCSSIVSRDTVRIVFLIAGLKDLDVLLTDVQNTYHNALMLEKVYTTPILEFGTQNVGQPVKIVRALYGFKDSGFHWRDHLAVALQEANTLAFDQIQMSG
jgi:hypothetical protein